MTTETDLMPSGNAMPGNVLLSTDGEVTIEFVECLADCGNAPVVLLNEDLLPKVTPAQADDILAKGKSK